MRFRLKNAIKRLWTYDTLLLEAFIGVEALILGITLVHPQSTFSSSSTYKFLEYVACEQTWGIGIICFVVLYLLAIACGKIKLRKLGITCMLAFWAFMAIGFYFGNPSGTGWPLQVGFSLGALWCILNLDGYPQ